MTDREIIQGFLGGGKQEYKQVLAWVTEAVRSKLWAERVAADDVIADATMKLLINLRDETFRLESSLKTYIQRITLYTLVDASRRVKRLSSLGDDDVLKEESTPHSIIEAEEKEKLFQRIVGLLSDKCRQLWVMTFEHELSSKEIAAKLGTSEGSVRTNLSRCKDKATEILKQIS